MAESVLGNHAPCKPSVSAARKARQQHAIAESRNEVAAMKARISDMENIIKQLCAQVATLQLESLAKSSSKQIDECGFPPGINVQDHLEQRLETLEQVFVLVDWQSLELAANTIISTRREKENTDFPYVPPFPVPASQPASSHSLVAVPPPLLGAQALQSQEDDPVPELASLLPDRKECCEHSLLSGSKSKLPEQTAEEREKISSLMQAIMARLDASKLLNS